MKSKTAAHRHQHYRHGEERPKPATPPMSDAAVYFIAFIVGGFTIMLGGLMTDATYWPHFGLLYLALLLYTTIMAGWSVYRARHIADWRQSLAKVPLAPVGYGTKRGKPLEAAHGQPQARTAMTVFTIASIILVAGLALLIFRAS
jgi:hypothetical protein